MNRTGLRAAAIPLLAAVALTSASRDLGAAAAPAAAADCPTELLPLGANPVAAASQAALRAERTRFRPQITGAAIATNRFDRSSQVVHNCGRRVAARSVVVTVHRRAYDSGPDRSASLAAGVVVVGRFPSGWRVWDVLH